MVGQELADLVCFLRLCFLFFTIEMSPENI
jgi:hypothetical protein